MGDGRVTVGLLVRLIAWCTGSRAAAVLGAAVFALSPDVVYLQATAMTEPLLMVLTVGAVWALVRALQDPAPGRVRLAGWLMASGW